MSSNGQSHAHAEELVVHEEEQPPQPDLDASELFLNRELTWLNFAKRVLHQASDERTPLLERVKFFAITGSILDEFFMKRIGGLKQQVAAGVYDRTIDGRTPAEQIAECHQVIREIDARRQALWPQLVVALKDAGIIVARHDELPEDDQQWIREHYLANIFPLVTPQAMDPAHPFPFVSNLSLNLLVSLRYPNELDPLLARVKVPLGGGVPRLIRVRQENTFVLLEEVVAANLDLPFPGMVVEQVELFRVTRNADVEQDEDKADDLLALIESELRERKFAPIVRLEVASGISAEHKGRLAAELDLDEEADVFHSDAFLAARDLMQLAALDIPELKYPNHRPIDHPLLMTRPNIFHAIREHGSILLHHPYDSFATSVERFIREASVDPKVVAIKMTLYRTSRRSRIVQHLVEAALNDKQVTVVMELKARFDEETNIRWANELERVGIHVTYGIVGLKTHCKVTLVLRQDHNGLQRYIHFGTGNYNEETAKLYADLGYLTNDPKLGSDVTELFNYLTTGYKPKRKYTRILPAPKLLKPALLAKIEREIECCKQSGRGLIQIKCNALEDVDITRALYRACQAGVQVDLLIRDTCRLRPGVPGISETACVVSVVGRFLEHGRVYHFANGGSDEYYIGSADCMTRNLSSRVEVLVPIESDVARAELQRLIDTQLADRRTAWSMDAEGNYTQRDGGVEGAQETMIRLTEKRFAQATRLKKRQPRTHRTDDF